MSNGNEQPKTHKDLLCCRDSSHTAPASLTPVCVLAPSGVRHLAATGRDTSRGTTPPTGGRLNCTLTAGRRFRATADMTDLTVAAAKTALPHFKTRPLRSPDWSGFGCGCAAGTLSQSGPVGDRRGSEEEVECWRWPPQDRSFRVLVPHLYTATYWTPEKLLPRQRPPTKHQLLSKQVMLEKKKGPWGCGLELGGARAERRTGVLLL